VTAARFTVLRNGTLKMGVVIHVDFRNKVKREATWLEEQERLFSEAMRDGDTTTPEEYYDVQPSDCE